MKLIWRKIESLERAHAAASSRQRPAGIAWTSDNVRVDREQLEPGEHIAVDAHVLDPGDWRDPAGRRAGAWSSGSPPIRRYGRALQRRGPGDRHGAAGRR